MKRYLGVLLLLVAFMLTGCGEDSQSDLPNIQGMWHLNQADAQFVLQITESRYKLVSLVDGPFGFRFGSPLEDTQYTRENDLVRRSGVSDVRVIEVSENRLVLQQDEARMEFTRIDEARLRELETRYNFTM